MKMKFDQSVIPFLLDGTKTQHRVLIDNDWITLFGTDGEDPEYDKEYILIEYFESAHSGSGFYAYNSEYPEFGSEKIKCPYKIGDTFKVESFDFEITNVKGEGDDGQWFWVIDFKKVTS